MRKVYLLIFLSNFIVFALAQGSNAPAVNVKNINAYLDSNGNLSLSVGDIDDGTTSNQQIDTMFLNKYNFNCNDIGTNDVILTAIDTSGNSSSDTSTVTVIDTISPTINFATPNIYLDSSGQATITASDIDNGSSDNCQVDTMWLSQYSFQCSDAGNNTLAFYVEDVNGNVASTTLLVLVKDTISPTVLTHDTTIYLDNTGVANITVNGIDVNSADVCGLQNLSLNKSSFSCSDIGTNTVQLTGTDNSGNTASKPATITVIDTIHPTVITHDIDVYLDATGSATINSSDVDNGSYDNCNFTRSLDVTSFDCSDTGSNTVTLTVTDTANNLSNSTATVTIHDTISPTINFATPNIYLDSSGKAGITASDIDNGSSDNCQVDTMWLSQYSFQCSDAGINTLYFYVKDVNGNRDSMNVQLLVKDTISPNIVINDTTIYYLDTNGVVNIGSNNINNGSDDACGIDSLWLSKKDFKCSDRGINNIYLIGKDANNNKDSAKAIVIIRDTIKPWFLNSFLDTLNNDTVCSGKYFYNDSPGNNLAGADNCSFYINKIKGPNSGDSLIADSVYTVSYKIEDLDSNSQKVSFNVKVNPIPDKANLILGNTSFCRHAWREKYTVSPNKKYMYEWNVTCGKILAGKYTSGIEVHWDKSTYAQLKLILTDSSREGSSCQYTNNYKVNKYSGIAPDTVSIKLKNNTNILACSKIDGGYYRWGYTNKQNDSTFIVRDFDTLRYAQMPHVNNSNWYWVDVYTDTSSCLTRSFFIPKGFHTSIEEKKGSNNIMLYPNPTDGTVNVKGVNISKYDIFVMDMNGNKVDFKNDGNSIVFAKENPSGMYLIYFINQTESVVRKIMLIE